MPDPITDTALLAQLNGTPIAAPKAVADPALLAQLNEEKPHGFVATAMDAIKGIPRNLAAGALDAATTGAQAESYAMSQPEMAATIPDTEHALQALETGVTGPMYQPQTSVGKIVGSGARAVSNPASYMGPGSLPLKIGGAILSGAGSETGRLMAENTPYETPMAIGGGLLGGVAGAKALGPTAERAAVPTAAELRAAADNGGVHGGYQGARNSGLELNPDGVAKFAATAEQDLTNGPKYGFTGGENGTAPKTLAILDDLQNAPAGATVTSSNLDTIRKNIGNIAGETRDFKPTADAKAAMVLKRHLDDYMENIPANHVVAGDPEKYVAAIKEANGNYAAASRLGTFDARLSKAENATDRQVAGSVDSQIKSNIGRVLDNPKQMRGLSQAEKDQIQLINSGTLTSNVLRQLGRGGTGVIPMGAHVLTAAATGGASIPASLGIGVPLYAAKKIAEGMTKGRASDLADMLAKRSPEYQSRLSAVQPVDTMPNKAAIARALIGAHLGSQ